MDKEQIRIKLDTLLAKAANSALGAGDKIQLQYILQSECLTKNVDKILMCCPWHEEKTPSFVYRTDTCHFHCFGCGTAGTINFLDDLMPSTPKEIKSAIADEFNVFMATVKHHQDEILVAINKMQHAISASPEAL